MSFETVEVLDRELAAWAKRSGPLRFTLALALDALASMGGHHELGFSSLEAYGLERCERAVRWVQQSRWLANKTHSLPRLREALFSGAVSWSMALEIAKVATSTTEADWLERARRMTVAAIQELVKAARNPVDHDDEASLDPDPDELCTLTITVDREDTWTFECARMLARRMDTPTIGGAVEAMLAEAKTALRPVLNAYPNNAALMDVSNDAQLDWNRQLEAFRKEAETRCEPNIPRWEPAPAELSFEVPLNATYKELDALIRRISAALTERELRIGELANQLFAADGWRRLRYATAKQYARERLGIGITSLNDKRALVRRLARLPQIAAALRSGRIGYEAARLVSQVASPVTDDLWATRAAERTLVHLSEDIDVATQCARLEVRDTVLPPEPALVEAMRSMESDIVSGRIFTEERTEMPADNTAAQLREGFAGALRTTRALGRTTLRLRVPPEIRAEWRRVERFYDKHRPLPMPFFRFACQEFVRTWAHELAPQAYDHIYARDGHRCTNPTCRRRRVTPHHLVYRLPPETERDEDLTSLCYWCHLEGVHENRIKVRRERGVLRWLFGEGTEVTGRTRKRAA